MHNNALPFEATPLGKQQLGNRAPDDTQIREAFYIYQDLRKYSDPLLSLRTFGSNYSQVFLGMTQKTLHTWIWGVSAILLCRSSQALSGWMGTIGGQPFSGLSREGSIGYKSGLWLSHSRTHTELSLSHSCVVLSCALGHCPVVS